jgi:hypothetical protein
MFKLSLVTCFKEDVQFKHIMPLKLNRQGITNPIITQFDFGSPYELKLDINVNSPAWQFFQDSKDYGIRLKTNHLDLVFTLFDRKKVINGVQKLIFMSSSFKLKFSQPLIHDLIYNGSGQQLVNRIDDNFVWTLVSGDRNINITTGLNNNLENLKQICDAAGTWTWLDGGIVEVNPGVFKTEILYGELNDIGKIRENSDPRFTPFRARKRNLLDNFLDLNECLIEYINENDSGEEFSHLFAIGDVGSGAALNDRIEFEESDISADWVNPQYPLVKVYNSFLQKDDIFVFNSFNTLDHKAFATKSFSLLGNSQTIDLLTVITKEDGKKRIYNQAVSYIKENANKRNITCGVALKRLALPGTLIYVQYKETIRLSKIEKIVVNNIKQVYPLRGKTFDLNKIFN